LLSSSSAPSAPVVEERAKVARTKADKNFMVNFIMGKSFFDSLLHTERERERERSSSSRFEVYEQFKRWCVCGFEEKNCIGASVRRMIN
jgi:hypothetical protein